MKMPHRLLCKSLCLGAALASSLGACVTETPETPEPSDSEATADLSSQANRVVVMTRNQYLGADLTEIITAPDPVTFNRAARAALDQIAANRFPERALSLALEVAILRPDVIGLQEVFN